MTKTKLIALYKAAEKRADACAAGVAFKLEDRQVLVDALHALNISSYEAAVAVTGSHRSPAFPAAHGRFQIFRRQVAIGVLRAGAPATGEHVGGHRSGVKVVKLETAESFDGRIKSKRDVQPAFNRAAVQLIRVGITSPADALRFLTAGFEFAKGEQKVHLKTEMLVQELQLGDLSREQVFAVLDKVKAKF